MLSPRHCKTALVFSLALYMGMVVINNVVDPNPNYTYVQHVLSMDTVLAFNTQKWRAINSPLLWQIGFFALVIYEAVVGVWLAVSGARMLRCPPSDWPEARQSASAAIVASMLFWIVPFLVVGGEWFQMWQSNEWDGIDAARGNFLIFGTVLIYLQSSEGQAYDAA